MNDDDDDDDDDNDDLSMLTHLSGILLTLATTSVFLKYNQTPVVKSSSRELSYTILIGAPRNNSSLAAKRLGFYAHIFLPLNQ